MESPEAATLLETAAYTAIARLMNHLGGGKHGRAPQEAAAAEIEKAWPGVAGEYHAALAFHSRAIAHLLTTPAAGGLDAARSAILTIMGYPPKDGEPLPHAEAAAVAPEALFLYLDPVPAFALLWEDALQGDPSASALAAPARDPAAVLQEAAVVGLEPPFCVLVPMALHWAWRGEIVRVLSLYAELLPPGSSIVLSWAAPGGRRTGGLIGDAVLAATGIRTHLHGPAEVEEMIAAAGLDLHPAGIREVSRWEPDAGTPWARERLSEGVPARFLGAVALRT